MVGQCVSRRRDSHYTATTRLVSRVDRHLQPVWSSQSCPSLAWRPGLWALQVATGFRQSIRVLQRARDGCIQGGALPIWLRRTAGGMIETVPETVAATKEMVRLRIEGYG